MQHLLGGEVPEATEKMFDRIKQRVDTVGGESYPSPWIYALIAEMTRAPVVKQSTPRKKKVEVKTGG